MECKECDHLRKMLQTQEEIHREEFEVMMLYFRALNKIAKGHEGEIEINLRTYSGTDCATIALEALKEGLAR